MLWPTTTGQFVDVRDWRNSAVRDRHIERHDLRLMDFRRFVAPSAFRE
jgi:hypothetical protein